MELLRIPTSSALCNLDFRMCSELLIGCIWHQDIPFVSACRIPLPTCFELESPLSSPFEEIDDGHCCAERFQRAFSVGVVLAISQRRTRALPGQGSAGGTDRHCCHHRDDAHHDVSHSLRGLCRDLYVSNLARKSTKDRQIRHDGSSCICLRGLLHHCRGNVVCEPSDVSVPLDRRDVVHHVLCPKHHDELYRRGTVRMVDRHHHPTLGHAYPGRGEAGRNVVGRRSDFPGQLGQCR